MSLQYEIHSTESCCIKALIHSQEWTLPSVTTVAMTHVTTITHNLVLINVALLLNFFGLKWMLGDCLINCLGPTEVNRMDVTVINTTGIKSVCQLSWREPCSLDSTRNKTFKVNAIQQ